MSASNSFMVNSALSGLHPVFLQAAPGAMVDLVGGSTVGHFLEHAGHYGGIAGVWVIRLLHGSGVLQTVYAVAFDHLHDAVVYAGDVDGDYEHSVSATTYLPDYYGAPVSVSHWLH